jgi:hypothetical protein
LNNQYGPPTIEVEDYLQVMRSPNHIDTPSGPTYVNVPLRPEDEAGAGYLAMSASPPKDALGVITDEGGYLRMNISSPSVTYSNLAKNSEELRPMLADGAAAVDNPQYHVLRDRKSSEARSSGFHSERDSLSQSPKDQRSNGPQYQNLVGGSVAV